MILFPHPVYPRAVIFGTRTFLGVGAYNFAALRVAQWWGKPVTLEWDKTTATLLQSMMVPRKYLENR